MNNVYLSNAFSLQMISEFPAVPIIEEAKMEEIKKTDFISVIGHADTAAVLSQTLGRTVEFNRESIRIEKNDILFVAQIMGGRLPEGCSTLPEGYEIKFIKVRVLYEDSLCVNAKGGVCDFITGCPCNCVHIG